MTDDVACAFIAISIHVPREGHDVVQKERLHMTPISIHVPRVGHDRDADPQAGRAEPDFNPRAPRGARRRELHQRGVNLAISIHVPREGHDAAESAAEIAAEIISIHVPREGHDAAHRQIIKSEAISIHVPREGHDNTTLQSEH